jgi:hypothetical protein
MQDSRRNVMEKATGKLAFRELTFAERGNRKEFVLSVVANPRKHGRQ